MQWCQVVTYLDQLLTRYSFNECGSGLACCSLESLASDDLDFFRTWVADGLPEPMFSHGDREPFFEVKDGERYLGNSVSIELSVKEIPGYGGEIYCDWENFISKKKNLSRVPENFYILGERVNYPTDSPVNKLKNYLDFVAFVEVLTKVADLKPEGTLQNFVFLHKERLDIPFKLSSSVLNNNLDGIGILKSIVGDDAQAEQKKSIFKECVYGLLSNVNESERLDYLVFKFGVLSKKFHENYRLFLSEFSFDEVRLEYEEKKREYIAKINDLAADTQGKMMGIPVSMALLAFKMQGVTDSQSFFSNLFLLVGIAAYAVMMMFLIKNQEHTLDAIKSEYISQMKRLENKYREQYEEVSSVKDELDARVKHQERYFGYFLYALFALVFVSVGWFLFTQSFDWVNDFFLWVSNLFGCKRSTVSIA